MSRGVQLLQLVSQFRAEVRQATQLSVGTDSLPHVQQLLRRIQEVLYASNEWDFLRMFTSKALAAGTVYYDAPANLNIDRIEEVHLVRDGVSTPIERGIGFEEYAQYDPDDTTQRSDLTQKWDLRWTGSSTQIEVWPRPATNDTKLVFKSMRPLRPLIANSDVTDLDGTLIVLFAAAEELAAAKSKDAQLKLQVATDYLGKLKANAKSGSSSIQLGLGKSRGVPSHAVVRAT